jgi:hypothetical protein
VSLPPILQTIKAINDSEKQSPPNKPAREIDENETGIWEIKIDDLDGELLHYQTAPRQKYRKVEVVERKWAHQQITDLQKRCDELEKFKNEFPLWHAKKMGELLERVGDVVERLEKAEAREKILREALELISKQVCDCYCIEDGEISPDILADRALKQAGDLT